MTCHLALRQETTFHEDLPRPPVPGGAEDEVYEGCNTKCKTGCSKQDTCCCSVASTSANNNSSGIGHGYTSAILHQQNSASSTIGNKSSLLVKAVDGGSTMQTDDRSFEPDGCLRLMPKFAEDTDLSMAGSNLKLLLQDSLGVSHFQKFLVTEKRSDVLEFWLACTGYRKVEDMKLRPVALAIFKKFLARSGDRVGVSSYTCQKIREHLKFGRVEQFVFDDALAEVELLLLKEIYPVFVSSAEYAEYLEAKSVNFSPSYIGTASNDSPCHSVREQVWIEQKSLQTASANEGELKCKAGENSELSEMIHNTVDISHQHPKRCSSAQSCRQFDNETLADSDYYTVGRSISPVRAPVASAQDSLSSDFFTDDTFSMTGSSLSHDDRDCALFSQLHSRGGGHWAERRGRMVNNKQTDMHARGMSRGGNMSEKDPQQFARLLIERLSQIRCGADQNEIENQLEHFRDGASGMSLPSLSNLKSAVKSALLIAAAVSEPEENAQSILERHMSRVFDSPDNQHTPTRSTDCQSPVTGLFAASQSKLLPATAVEQCSSNNDSAKADRVTSQSNNNQEFSHFDGLRQVSSRSCHSQTTAASRRPNSLVKTDKTSGNSVYSATHKAAELTSNAVTGADFRQFTLNTQPEHPHCNHTCAADKVMSWMIVNDHLQSSGVHAVGHEVQNLSMAQNKMSSNASWTNGIGRMPLPAQPIVQDPMMPLLTPPDPMTQLEEARRRLQLESTARIPPKSIMYGGSSFMRENGIGPTAGMSPSLQVFSRPGRTANQPTSQDDCSGLLHRASASKMKMCEQHPTSVPCTPVQLTQTGPLPASIGSVVVVYFLCDEPIPYSTKASVFPVTLGHFKELVAKKGSYRYYFKRACNDFNSGYVYEEVADDVATLPLLDGKICAKVVRATEG